MLDLADLIINHSEREIINSLEEELVINNIQDLDLNKLDRFGFCPLIEAVICNKPKVLKYLLQQGANVDQLDILGRTALQWAVERGYVELCKILLDHNANPNHYSLDGQPILVYPILRGNLELVELLKEYQADHLFAQDFISSKLLGHRFELTGETDIVSPDNKFIPLSFEGFYLEFSVGLIARSLNDFINSIAGQEFEDLQGKLYKILYALKNASTLASFAQHKDKTLFADSIEDILEQPLLLLPCAYAGHAITFIKYKNYLAKCDRGVNNITDTVIIYEVGNKYLLNKQLFYKLLYEEKTEDFINYEIKDYLSLVPIKALPTRSQIAGNCSFANVETSVPAMLYMLFDIEQPKAVLQAEKNAYYFYKKWLEWDKDSALEEAIADFNSADLERKISKAVMIGSVLIQRCQAKFAKHIERAKKILEILLLPAYQFILRNFIIIYNKASSGNTGKNFVELLTKCGFSDLDLKNIVLKKYSKHPKDIQAVSDTQHIDPDLVKMSTALHVACLHNRLAVVKYLIEQLNMDVNYVDRTGSTALMYAAWKGHINIVKMLVLQYQADPTIQNLKHATALQYAEHAGHTEIVEFLQNQGGKIL